MNFIVVLKVIKRFSIHYHHYFFDYGARLISAVSYFSSSVLQPHVARRRISTASAGGLRPSVIEKVRRQWDSSAVLTVPYVVVNDAD